MMLSRSQRSSNQPTQEYDEESEDEEESEEEFSESIPSDDKKPKLKRQQSKRSGSQVFPINRKGTQQSSLLSQVASSISNAIVLNFGKKKQEEESKPETEEKPSNSYDEEESDW